jgi:hypothetical protein
VSFRKGHDGWRNELRVLDYVCEEAFANVLESTKEMSMR